MNFHYFRGKQACPQALSLKELTECLNPPLVLSRPPVEHIPSSLLTIDSFLQTYAMSLAFATTRRSSKASEDEPTVCVSTTLKISSPRAEVCLRSKSPVQFASYAISTSPTPKLH
ncbi:hypothetical protein sscle_05g044260 [Sclerotinia sclerotiorum 1980 UF-70]|uniref:Uncharacterized protein n=1 Tax=Sclerotinia sclerotiorum (strain ATCC 18683 / 1980 / Ss-1) TaxID=665079 RepID=A0A1D9Q437_SCLS1|nr:hypothetical protein sscle_05g044260 [Sclerotinia sclerotiorum 1980 UF-70]